MRSWVRTGLLSIAIYMFIFFFNYFFVRQSIAGEVIVMIVTAPVYFLLQIFGIVDISIFFLAGILFYFLIGAGIDLAGTGIDKLFRKFRSSKD